MTAPDKRIIEFIKKHHVLTLATCVENECWCCNCFYVYLEEENAFLFTSDADTKHIRMATLNTKVSGSVVLETSVIGKIRGIQFSGELKKVENSENSKYTIKYLSRFPFAIIHKTDLWKIDIKMIKMTDKYLTPYVFRVAISNSRIVKVEDGTVFFRYKKTGSNRQRTLALDALEFIRRFLQHVLPTGFMKVRYYGFLSPASRVALEEVRVKIEFAFGFSLSTPEAEPVPLPAMTCRHCGCELTYRHSILPHRRRMAARAPPG